MGMEKRVAVTNGGPSWSKVADELAKIGFPVQMRLIDGELALPDEVPPDQWRELRVAHQGAMVTVRREAEAIVLVAWSNADAEQLRLWNALAEVYTAQSNAS